MEEHDQKELLMSVKDLKKYYPVHGGFFKKTVGHVKALDGVSLDLHRGETVGIVGESGCGKSTLGNLMMLLTEPTNGEVLYNKDGQMTSMMHLNKEDSMDFRKNVQMIFQDPYSSLNPSKKIYDSLMLPLKIHMKGTDAERENVLEETLKVVHLDKRCLYRYPHEFSGGQRQRICIARALCLYPQVIICDEPVSALDVSIQAQVLNLMKKIQRDRNMAYVFIAHDLSVVQYMSERIVVMYLGKVVEISGKMSLYKEPLHPYTKALLSAIPIPVLGAKKDRIILNGDVPSPINKPKGCPFHIRCGDRMEICEHLEPELTDIGDGRQVACHLYRQ